ncbi:hypothetical protein NMG60_11012376 [Bertholletia excelsa]
MADTLGNGEFWLPSEFLTDNDMLKGKENLNKTSIDAAFGVNFGFPVEIPYDFASCCSSSVLSSPVESVVGSTETESDEEDLLFGLTRQLAFSRITSAPRNLEKSRVSSGSPQSTLGAVESWSGSSNGPSQVPSPPTTPPGGDNDAWDLIYAAAGQVARLKMNGGEGPPGSRGFLGHSRSVAPPPTKSFNTGSYAHRCFPHDLSQTQIFEHARQNQVLKQQCSSVWGRPVQKNQFQQQVMSLNRGGRVHGGGEFMTNGRYARPVGLSQSAWPPLQVQNQDPPNRTAQMGGSGMRAVFLGGSGVKRGCAGTGVFLPRRFGNSPSESRKKPGCSTALLPERVVQALNKNLDHMTVQAPSQPPARFNTDFVPDYDTMMARRNSFLTQQRSLRPEGAMTHDSLCLPQEWTY